MRTIFETQSDDFHPTTLLRYMDFQIHSAYATLFLEEIYTTKLLRNHCLRYKIVF